MSDIDWDEETKAYQGTTVRANNVGSAQQSSPLTNVPPSPSSHTLPPSSSPSAFSFGKSPSGTSIGSPRAGKTGSDTSSHKNGGDTTDSDEEDGDDVPSLPNITGWLMAKDVESEKVFWYHPQQLVVSFENPADRKTPISANGTSFVVEDVNADAVDDRRNSMILSETWENPQQRWERKRSIGGLEDMLSGRGGKKNVQLVINRFLQSTTAQTDVLLDKSTELPDAVVSALRDIKEHLQTIQQALENEAKQRDDRNDVDALIDYDKLSWKFDNPEVHNFRARASRVPHSSFLFKEWHIPQFPSVFPLPADVLSHPITCVVKFPGGAADDALTHSRVSLTSQDSVQEAINKCFASYKKRQTSGKTVGGESEYVLKATGFREFMDGDRKLVSFEYVRNCLRNNQELELSLVKRPTPIDPTEASQQLSLEYKGKVDPNIKILTINDYINLDTSRLEWDELHVIPMAELAVPFRVRICAVDKLIPAALPRLDSSMTAVFVRAFIFHGATTIGNFVRETQPLDISINVRFMEWLKRKENTQELFINNIPRASRICFLLYGKVYDKSELLGYSILQLVDAQGRFRTGRFDIRLWGMGIKVKEGDLAFLYRATTRDNLFDQDAAVLTVEFDEFMLPVVAPIVDMQREPNLSVVGPELPFKNLDKVQQKRLLTLVESDTLTEVTEEDKQLLWLYRHQFVAIPSALPKFLESVDWTNVDCRAETYRLLSKWAPPVDAAARLELLDCKFADYRVRELAVNALRALPDEELQMYLLQLVQCLKYEPYHDSPLARFLIERSLKNPLSIGHHFFWHMKAELATPDCCERFAVILEEFLSHCGDFSKELRKQNTAVLKLQRVAELIVKLKLEQKYSDQQCMKEYANELEKLNRDFFSKIGSFQVPLNPKWEASTLIVEKCRYMSSKKVPLWLVFNNADVEANPIYILFKAGDDLRQDILTLQVLKIMDKIWLTDNLDMRLKPYRCIATGVNDEGEGIGMIEIVMNSDTTSGIQLKYGGGAIGALRVEPLDLFIRDHNKGTQYDRAVENFIRSCAGYCVATFVMGIGDRHNGNIMVTKDGHLFHIDFGHFLGNFKKKFGINRERTPFVFTPEMAFVMGGKKYQQSNLFKKFKELCCQAFNALRRHASLLESLFILMVPAGMPELSHADDVTYLRDKLLLDLTDKDAEKAFKKEIKRSLENTSRRIDNWIHNAKHG